MPIRPFLDGQSFDRETTRIIGLAFEMARASRRLSDRSDLADRIIALRIIALAKAGERDPEKLCDGALKIFGK